MATRPSIYPNKVITTASMATDVISAVTVTRDLTLIGYTVVWTGVPNGNLQVEVCNDAIVSAQGNISGGTWDTLLVSYNGSLVSQIPTGSTSGSVAVNIADLAMSFIRLHYVVTSGTGVLNATVSGKVS